MSCNSNLDGYSMSQLHAQRVDTDFEPKAAESDTDSVCVFPEGGLILGSQGIAYFVKARLL